jgi:tetratricopeptide (TPR) repeat protein
VPAGVDSIVAVRADSLADASFVEAQRQDSALVLQEQGRLMVERTDSLWNAMSELLESGREVTPSDSMAARDAANVGGGALVALDSLLRDSDVDVEQLTARTAILLDSAQIALERSFQLNPFDNRSRVWLAQVYGLQARRLGQSEAYERAIQELEKLALLTPDQHTVFAMLANNYFYVENWDGAALNYQRAEEVYLGTYDLAADVSPSLDSAVVFSYVQAQGDMHVQRFDAAGASMAFDRALEFATTAEDSAYIADQTEWMAWDDQNIRAAFARDSLLALEQSGDLEGARRGYLALAGEVTARGAVDETDWRLAIVDYNLSNTEAAADRLQRLVARAPVDSAGVPSDPDYQRYFEDYGTLCLNIGRRFRVEERDSRTALKYFRQSAELQWSGRAAAHFEVARLVQGNVDAALESANAAVAEEEALTVEQRLELYRLLMELNRRAGDFDQARAFRDAYRALRGG